MEMADHWYANTKRLIALIILIALVVAPLILSQITIKHLEKAPTICLYKNITGKDCWGCGTSRAIISILQLEFKQAYEYNKRIVLVFPLLVYLWFKWFVLNLRVVLDKKKPTTNPSYN